MQNVSAQSLKNDFRQRALAARKAMGPAEVASKSRGILTRLMALPEMTASDTLLTYVSSRDNEVDTIELIEAMLQQTKTVLVPVAEPEGVLAWSRLYDLSVLEPSTFGILEPPEGSRKIVAPPAPSVAVIPGLAFTKKGIRLGYGAGYYDRFLRNYTGSKIALAYESQLFDDLPREPHDAPVGIVVTERAVYHAPTG